MFDHDREDPSLQLRSNRAPKHVDPLRIESRRWLVQEKEIRSVNQRPGQGEPLPLTSGERPRGPVGDAAQLKPPLRVRPRGLRLEPIHLSDQRHILPSRKIPVGEQLVRHPADAPASG